MGTSSSHSGPIGKSPLLPSWAPENSGNENNPPPENTKVETDSGEINATTDQQQKKIPVITDHWSAAKGALKRYAIGTGRSSLRKASRRYVQALKGSKNATKGAQRGISIGGDYVNFLNGIATGGLEETLRKYSLTDCIGKSSDEVFAKIVDRIAPVGTTSDDAIARCAMISAMEKLWELNSEMENDPTNLDTLTVDNIKELIREFVSAYIFQKWIYEVGITLEKNDLTEKEIIDLEIEIKQFIRDEVKVKLKGKDSLNLDYKHGEGKKLIESVFELAYSILEK